MGKGEAPWKERGKERKVMKWNKVRVNKEEGYKVKRGNWEGGLRDMARNGDSSNNLTNYEHCIGTPYQPIRSGNETTV